MKPQKAKPKYDVGTGHMNYSGYGYHVTDKEKSKQRHERKLEIRNAKRFKDDYYQ